MVSTQTETNTHNPCFYTHLFMRIYMCGRGNNFLRLHFFMGRVPPFSFDSTRLDSFVLFLVDHFMASVRVFISLAVLKGFQVHVLH